MKIGAARSRWAIYAFFSSILRRSTKETKIFRANAANVCWVSVSISFRISVSRVYAYTTDKIDTDENGMIDEAEFVAFFAGLTNPITDEEKFNKGELVVILAASSPLRVDNS